MTWKELIKERYSGAKKYPGNPGLGVVAPVCGVAVVTDDKDGRFMDKSEVEIRRLHRMYLATPLRLADFCRELDIPEDTLLRWFRVYGLQGRRGRLPKVGF